MSKLVVRKAGDPILRKKSIPVKKIDKKIKKMLDDMAETMYDSNGVGLAAPQIGENLRVIIIDVGDELIELINPELLSFEGTQLCEQEGCLSIPGFFGVVERAEKIDVKFLNRQGKRIFLTAEGFKAQAIQHEIDHLDGILFIDRAKSVMKAEPIAEEV